MFHTETDASKIALLFLVEFLQENNFQLLDTQYINDHLVQFGAIEIPNEEYEELLARALE
jgi:leucyl/phenylalanyl-tRNA---protein transferase